MPNKPAPTLLGLMGFPIAHSQSPGFMAEFATAEQRSGVEYRLFESPYWPEDRNRWWEASGSPKGFNVTLPFKEKMGLWVDRWTPEAQAVGAINTVAVLASGEWLGHNTDADGFWESLPLRGFPPSSPKALLLGAGGAARAVHHALTTRGWTVDGVYRSTKPPWMAKSIPWDSLINHPLDTYSLLVHATPMGSPAQPGIAPKMNWKTLANNTLAVDLVYHPTPTPWMQNAVLHGALAQDGRAMLRAQAKKAWDFWKSSGVIPEI